MNFPQNALPALDLPMNLMRYVRFGIGALYGVIALLFVAALIVGHGQLRQVCNGGFCHPMQLSATEAAFNAQLGLTLGFYATYTTVTFLVFGGAGLMVGALILWHRPTSWMGQYVALVMVTLGVGAVPILNSLEVYFPAIRWLSSIVLYVGLLSLPIVLFTFPDGKFVPSWLIWLVGLWLCYSLITFFLRPLPTTGVASGPPGIFTQLVFVAGGLSQVFRYVRAPSAAYRQQTKWALFGFAGHAISVLILVQVLFRMPELSANGIEHFVYERYAFAIVGLLPILFIPLSVSICILRFHLWDIDIVINRALVYISLTGIVIVLYAAVVSGLSYFFHSTGAIFSLIATGIVAVSFHTLRERIQRTINRLIYGHRDEPYVVLERLLHHLEPVVTIDDILPGVARTVGQALRLPYVAIALKRSEDFERVASYSNGYAPSDQTSLTTLPLSYQSEDIGQLQVAPRVGENSFSPTDLKLLEAVGRQASIAAYNVRLTLDLQRSRENLVTMREEERRRLRRDLHDGLGPLLATMSFRLDEIHNVADSDSERTKAIAAELKTQVKSSLAEIRRIAYNLRPPALDELGLVGALREHLSALGSHRGPTYLFTTSERRPALPAAVEVAAYRIVLEAVTNVQHHANATMCRVHIGLGDRALHLTITDDGKGIPEDRRMGVGLTAMRERAAELGGTCTILNLGPGVRVEAMLPL